MLSLLFGMSSSPVETFARILAYIFVVLFAITIHEFAHGFASYQFGDNTAKLQGRLSLNPLRHMDPLGMLCFLFVGFGWAKPVQINPLKYKNYKLSMSIVSLAGIVSNLLLAFVFSGFLYFFYSLSTATNGFMLFLFYLMYYGVIINLALAIFNMLPIYPLDGFNFIRTFLKPNNFFVDFMFKYGNIVLLIFIITPFFDIIYEVITTFLLNSFFMFWGLF